jgi:hypothetical protein
MQKINEINLGTWRLDVALDSVVPIPAAELFKARQGLGPAGGQSPNVNGGGRPVVNLYANAFDRVSGEQVLERQLEMMMGRLQRWAPSVLEKSPVTYAGPALPPTT